MRGPSLASSALAARLLFTITLVSRYSFAADTTSVQDGDTFQAMADSAGIPVASLEAANPGVNADSLYVGQAINMPSNNKPAAATPTSESESSTATAAAVSTTSSPTSTSPTASSATSSVSSTFSTSILPSSSTSTTPSSTSTTPSPTSPTPSSTSTTTSPTSTTPSPTSTTPSPTSTTPSSTTPVGPTTTPPVSPVAAPSCKPTPSGKYHDAAAVQSKTNLWCSQVASTSEKDIVGSPDMSISGSSQGSSGHDGNQPNEEGYNMTITAISPMCDVLGATAQYPLGSADTNDNCSTILYNAYQHCYNDGMGGSIAAGCLIYAFEPDP